MGVKLRFRWDGEEGVVVGADSRKLLEQDWLVAADFLADIISTATKLYNEVLQEKKEQQND